MSCSAKYRSPFRNVGILCLFFASPFTRRIHAQSLRGPAEDNGILVYPTCLRCPDPSLTPKERLNQFEGVVVLRATVTEGGKAEQIEVVRGFDSDLANRALIAVRRWRFTPAIGKDGKPRAARVPIVVTFGLRKKGGIATG